MDALHIEEVVSTLEAMGGHRWTKGSLDRVYFDSKKLPFGYSELSPRRQVILNLTKFFVDLKDLGVTEEVTIKYNTKITKIEQPQLSGAVKRLNRWLSETLVKGE